ncbi:MAG: 2OG-Fe(II) oxygenase [Alphaproteobacteria bacterium]|nr:2OG-Fe(II) oxygenase [Alphaproteobacteria bacterium]
MGDHNLEARAVAGDTAAQLALGNQAESAGDTRTARGWFAQAAKAGRLDGLRRLAVNLLENPPFEIAHGLNMLRAAADQGDAEAAHLFAIVAADDPTLRNRWTVALDYLLRAADGGHALAQEQLLLLSPITSARGRWTELRAAIDIARWLTVPSSQMLNAAPTVKSIPEFLPHTLCDWMIARASTGMTRATVNNPLTGKAERVDSVRTNSQAQFPFAKLDVVMMLIKARMAAVSGIPVEGFEPPMVLHYAVGEEYRPHFDFFDLAVPGQAHIVAQAGQRVATFLVTLNDDFDGGETDFPRLNVRWRGKKGDALLFFNVDGANRPDPKTLHAGLPPTRGEKWLLSQWIRRPR